jgi:hypothetical protein
LPLDLGGLLDPLELLVLLVLLDLEGLKGILDLAGMEIFALSFNSRRRR